MVAKTGVVTAEELLVMPDDGYRYELVRGELRKMAPAGAEHSNIGMTVGTSLNVHVKANNLGAVFGADGGFLLARNPDTVRAPDVGFVRRERMEETGLVRGYWPGAPDLAVEVISPNDLYTEVAEKVEDWLNAGTRTVVVVDPRRRTVSVHRPRAGGGYAGRGGRTGGGRCCAGLADGGGGYFRLETVNSTNELSVSPRLFVEGFFHKEKRRNGDIKRGNYDYHLFRYRPAHRPRRGAGEGFRPVGLCFRR